MKTFKSADFNYQVYRSLGKCTVNFAEVGECFAVSERIEDGNIESWHSQWWDIAERLHEQAEQCKIRGAPRKREEPIFQGL